MYGKYRYLYAYTQYLAPNVPVYKEILKKNDENDNIRIVGIKRKESS